MPDLILHIGKGPNPFPVQSSVLVVGVLAPLIWIGETRVYTKEHPSVRDVSDEKFIFMGNLTTQCALTFYVKFVDITGYSKRKDNAC